LPANFDPHVGEEVHFRQWDGQIVTAIVIETTDLNITIDANHPLAGKDLTFDIQFVEVI